ncbi:MAG: class I SAM-dependent methyltransferase family protein [Candidatus Caldarchaeum sp.]
MLSRPSVKYLGHVALMRIPLGFKGSVEEVAQKLLREYSRVKTVVLIERVEGVHRVPRTRVLAGLPVTETLHRENGIVYKLDVQKLMFSLGNSFERRRMRSLPRRGEVIVDMFAGVGQFTVPLAKSQAEKVYAFEINPEAYRYLVENLKLNKVEHRVTAFLDDCRNAPSYGLEASANRVIMGYFPGTLDYLPTALKIVKVEGGYIHFHELAKPVDGWKDLYERCRAIADRQGFKLELEGKRGVKSYSPKLWHWVLDLRTSL